MQSALLGAQAPALHTRVQCRRQAVPAAPAAACSSASSPLPAYSGLRRCLHSAQVRSLCMLAAIRMHLKLYRQIRSVRRNARAGGDGIFPWAQKACVSAAATWPIPKPEHPAPACAQMSWCRHGVRFISEIYLRRQPVVRAVCPSRLGVAAAGSIAAWPISGSAARNHRRSKLTPHHGVGMRRRTA